MEVLPDRLKSKIWTDNSSGCWIWTAARDRLGYGRMMGSKSENRPHKTFFAHRYIYALLVGEPGLELDHLCRNPSCVNPKHLEQVTHRENMIRGKGPKTQKARWAKKRRCPQGHGLWGSNLYIAWSNRDKCINRQCRTCKREGARRRYHRLKT